MSEKNPSIQGSVRLSPSSVPSWVPPVPEGKKRYRLITGPDNAEFCDRVSEAIAEGYLLHGSPTSSTKGDTVIVGQAVVWPSAR